MREELYFYNYHVDGFCRTVKDHNELRDKYDRNSQTCSLYWKTHSPWEAKTEHSDFRHVAFFKEDGTISSGWSFHIHRADNGEAVAIAFKSTHPLTVVDLEMLVVRKGWVKRILEAEDNRSATGSYSTPRRLVLA